MFALHACICKVLRPPFGGAVFFLGCLLICWTFPAMAAQETKPAPGTMSEPGMAELDFAPPPAGSYELQYIMPAADGEVLDTEGNRRRLSEFTGGKVTLLSFIYSTCADPKGCPYAYLVFHNLKTRIGLDPRLHGKVRLASLSFDPKRDTPQMLKLYAGDHVQPCQPVEWNFLTTASLKQLIPILDDFGQDVFIDIDPKTKEPVGTLSHVLKVFLIDHNHVVREIYTTVYLHPDMVFNDILTLLMEQGLKLQ